MSQLDLQPHSSHVESLGNIENNGLVVGRLQYWKGVTVLCEALRILADKAPTINWIGRDMKYGDANCSMSDYLDQHYRDIWRNKIIPLGTFSPEITRQYQSQARFILVPSIWDVFNFTCVEGMAQGKVVICSEGAGAANLIRHGINGLTFKENDPQSLADSLEIFLEFGAEQLESIGKAAQATVTQILDPQVIAQNRIASYQDLIQRGKSPIKPNQWLVNSVSPQQQLDRPLSFLDYLPLRSLIDYTIQRSISKVFKKL